MLYILPPPSAKPPSVWDLIINFHRKGCQEAASSSTNPKKLLKFDCRETKKSQRTWCKTSPSDQSHVSILSPSWPQKTLSREAIVISFTFSRRQTRHGHKKTSFIFHPKRDFLISLRFDISTTVAFVFCWGKWTKSFLLFTHGEIAALAIYK